MPSARNKSKRVQVGVLDDESQTHRTTSQSADILSSGPANHRIQPVAEDLATVRQPETFY